MSQAPKLNIPTQDDTTPLLGRPSHPRGSSVSSEATLVEDEVTPLPLGQLTVLFLVRLAEPINFTVIFPFVNKMMEDLKVTDKTSDIGFYSGLVDSVFAVFQCLTILQWGRLSDRVGRRPVITMGLCGSLVSILLFGTSKTLTGVLVSRSIGGIMSGNVAVIQSILAEITDSTNEAKAMPLTAITWSLGCVIGPLIGGSLYHPAERWPGSWLDISLFRHYPYLLPCATAAIFTLVSLTLVYYFLNETLSSENESPISKVTYTASSPDHLNSDGIAVTPVDQQETTILSILLYPPLRALMSTQFLISILATAYDVVFILVCFTPIDLGGLSRNPSQIGLALAVSGMISTFLLPGVFPRLQKRVGTTRLFVILAALWPFIYLFFPLLNIIARLFATGDPNAPLTPVGELYLWMAFSIPIVGSRVAGMSFSLSVMMTKSAAPNKKMLGCTYGVAQTVTCIARAIAPTLVSSLFAVSVDKQLFGGNAVWFIMIALSMWTVHLSTGLHHQPPSRKRISNI